MMRIRAQAVLDQNLPARVTSRIFLEAASRSRPERWRVAAGGSINIPSMWTEPEDLAAQGVDA
jgi:hypothetical protein